MGVTQSPTRVAIGTSPALPDSLRFLGCLLRIRSRSLTFASMTLPRTLIVSSLVSLAALAQVPGASASRLPDAADGGPLPAIDAGALAEVPKARPAPSTRPRPDQVGVMRSVAEDGGTSGERVPSGPPSTARDLELARLRLRVQVLEERVAASQEQSDQLQAMNEQLQALRQQMADAEAQRATVQEEAAGRVQAQEQATFALSQALVLLAGGNSAGLGAALANAEAALTGQARSEVAQARAALAHDDLYNARLLLTAAVAHARQR